MAEKFVSFLPSEMITGGLISDVDATFTNCRFEMYDYGDSGEFCAFVADLDDGEGDIHEQAWSVGGDGSFAPSEDGERIVPVGDRTRLVKSSNFGLLMQDFGKHGLDESKLGNKISKLNGTKAHVMRMAAKGRGDLDQADDDQETGRRRGQEYLGVTNVHSYGYEGKGKGRKTAKKAAKASTKSEESTDSDSEDVAIELVIANLTEAGAAKELADLELEVYQSSKGRGNPAFRKEVREYVKDQDWLASLDNVSVDADNETAELSE